MPKNGLPAFASKTKMDMGLENTTKNDVRLFAFEGEVTTRWSSSISC